MQDRETSERELLQACHDRAHNLQPPVPQQARPYEALNRDLKSFCDDFYSICLYTPAKDFMTVILQEGEGKRIPISVARAYTPATLSREDGLQFVGNVLDKLYLDYGIKVGGGGQAPTDERATARVRCRDQSPDPQSCQEFVRLLTRSAI